MVGDEEKEQSNPKGQPSENFISTSKGFDGVFDLVGGSNLFQWLLFALVSIQGTVMVNHHLGFVFLGAVPEHWCRVGELSSSPWTLDQIKNISIPRKTQLDGKVVPDNCKMYDMNYTELATSSMTFDSLLETINFSQVETKTCSEWDFDKSIYTSTVVTQFNLVCGRRHLVASIQASYMVGVLVGSLLLGSMSDKLLGRRKAILVSVTLIMVSGLAAAFAKSFIAFSLFRFLVAVGVSGSYQNCYVLLLEHSDKSYRSLLGIIQQMPFAIGYMTIPVYAYFIRSWDHLQLSFALTTFTLLVYFWILPESARWLASMGRDDEAIEKLHSMAKWNGKPLPDKNKLLPILRTCREEVTHRTEIVGFFPRLVQDIQLTVSNYLNLIKTPELRRRSFAIWALFSAVALVYFGVVMDSATFSSDPFLMVFLGGLMEVPAYAFTEPFVSKWGRRPTLISLFALTGTVFLAFVATPEEHQNIRISFAMAGKLFVTSAFAVIYLLGAELYPTSTRMTGLGSAVLMGRFGSITAPYVVDMLTPIYRDLPTAIFGIVAFLGAGVAFFLPETKDLEMTDLVTEVEKEAQPVSLNVSFRRRSSCKATVEIPTFILATMPSDTL